jgi:hypothetical protein
MRLIDADELKRKILAERDKIPREVPTAPYEIVRTKPFQHGNSMRGGIRKALKCMEQTPTIDAVEVVRCKDCKCGKVPDMTCQADKYRLCGLYSSLPIMRLDDFCSYGEKRGEG